MGLDGFDAPRRAFLKRRTTVDVSACPGSGKTTLIVAKLAILAGKWPHRTRGICVLSHTNVAREQIEHRLGSSVAGQRLLSYPHFIDTIHGFVNRFLALPWLLSNGYPSPTIDDDVTTAYRRGVLGRVYYKVQSFLGVDPNSWTPDPLGRRYPPCRDQDRRTRRSSGARWLSWCEPDGVRKSCHESSSRRRRRSATGSCKASVTRGVAGMGQAPRSERSCVAFAERIVGCAKNEISWQKPRPGLLGGPYRGGLPVHESESGRVSNRHDGPSARSLPERVLRVAHP